jgi:hypothetical protein
MASLLPLLINAAATLFMTGLIWFVQVVHYPLFAGVGPREFPAYSLRHQRLTTLVVAPAMLIEAAAASWLTLAPPSGVPAWMPWSALLLLGSIWLSTAVLQMPLHGRLAAGFDAAAIRRLVAGNWIRTAAWSVRSLLAIAMLDAAVS